MESFTSNVYSGLSVAGYPLSIISAVTVTAICGVVIYVAFQAKKGINKIPLPGIGNGNDPLTNTQINIMLGISVLMVALSWLWVFLSYKYKPISAIFAASTILLFIASLFSK